VLVALVAAVAAAKQIRRVVFDAQRFVAVDRLAADERVAPLFETETQKVRGRHELGFACLTQQAVERQIRRGRRIGHFGLRVIFIGGFIGVPGFLGFLALGASSLTPLLPLEVFVLVLAPFGLADRDAV